MAACSGSTATTGVRNHRYCRSSVTTLKRQGFCQVRAGGTITVGDAVGIYGFHWRYPSRSTAHCRLTTSCTFPATPRFPPRRSSAFVMSSCRVSAPEPLDAWLPSTSAWSSSSVGNPYRKKDDGAEWPLRRFSGSTSCGEFAPVLKNASRLAASTWSREAGDQAGRPGFFSTSTEVTPA
jgi:hypothetical protein